MAGFPRPPLWLILPCFEYCGSEHLNSLRREMGWEDSNGGHRILCAPFLPKIHPLPSPAFHSTFMQFLLFLAPSPPPLLSYMVQQEPAKNGECCLLLMNTSKMATYRVLCIPLVATFDNETHFHGLHRIVQFWIGLGYEFYFPLNYNSSVYCLLLSGI